MPLDSIGVGQLLDQAGVLGDPDEVGRRHGTSDGVGPAHERLGTDDDAGAEVELRLVVEPEVVAFDGGAQVTEHRQSRRRAAVDLVAVRLDAEALRLGVERGDVGAADGDRRVGVIVDHGDADAGGDDQLEPVQRDRAGRLGEAALGEGQHLALRLSR